MSFVMEAITKMQLPLIDILYSLVEGKFNFSNSTHRVNLQDARPAAEEPPVVVHDVAEAVPVVARLVLEHLANVLVRLASHSDGVRQIHRTWGIVETFVIVNLTLL